MSRPLNQLKEVCSHLGGLVDEFRELLNKYTQLPEKVNDLCNQLVDAVGDLEIALDNVDDSF